MPGGPSSTYLILTVEGTGTDFRLRAANFNALQVILGMSLGRFRTVNSRITNGSVGPSANTSKTTFA